MQQGAAPTVPARPGRAPLVVGIGGTTRTSSSTARALETALAAAASAGARIATFDGPTLARLPIYAPHDPHRTEEARAFVAAVRDADGLIVASPAYHGGLSGMVKNALDYLEDLRDDDRPYLSHRPVGCIAAAAGWQATVTTLTALRAVVHALRGWPTPMGAAVNTAPPAEAAEAAAASARFQLETVGSEVVEFAMHHPAGRRQA